MLSQALATKLISVVGQIIVAWFLLKEDLGLAAITYTFSIVPAIIQQGGLLEVLIQRQRHSDRWSSSGFWLALTLGFAGCALMAVAAPVAANWYNEPRLLGLMLLIAVLFPLDAMAIVPMARVQGQMRFRLSATLGFIHATGLTLLTVIFAKLGWGPFALVAPRPIMSAVMVITYWLVAPGGVKRHPRVRRWRFLLNDSSYALGAYACDQAMVYGPYLVLSVLFATDVVGLYFFAFQLSLQTLALVTSSLGGVLFPALTTLQDQPQRQTLAFLRAIRFLACVAAPACLLQAALAEPGVHLLFKERWWDGIGLLQILSVGMVMRTIGRPAVSLMQAQARFGVQFKVAFISMCLCGIMIIIGARAAGATGAAFAAALHLLIVEPINLYVAIRPGGKGLADLIGTLLRPLLLGILTIGPAWLVGELVKGDPTVRWHQALRLLIVVATAGIIYLPLFRLLVPESWNEGVARIRAIAKR
jgi:PST family polysaccharide transporter